jgi:hypothetical protein
MVEVGRGRGLPVEVEEYVDVRLGVQGYSPNTFLKKCLVINP